VPPPGWWSLPYCGWQARCDQSLPQIRHCSGLVRLARRNRIDAGLPDLGSCVMHGPQPTSSGATSAMASKASAVSPAPHQTQVGARRLLSPAVGVWRLTRQDCKLGRGDVSPVLSRIPRLVPPPSPGVWTNRPVRTSLRIGLNSRVRAFIGCASPFHSATSTGSRPAIGNTLTDQQFSQAQADRFHVQVLPSSLICCINKCTQARTNKCHSVTGSE
jgi:hypothetical protein